MINIEIKSPYKKLVSATTIEDYAIRVLNMVGSDEKTDLSVLIDSDSTLQKLNHLYLGYNQPTDVLSFESHEIDPETGRSSLGDIAISFPMAEKQAIEAGHPLENELILLLVHGILHLSGYDHSTITEKQTMWQEQQEILDELNIKINRISGDEEFHD